MKQLFVVFATIILTSSGFATILVVDQSGGGDYTTIHAAVDDAADEDTVLVSSGNYIISAGAGVITVDKPLTILGSGYDLPENGGTLLQTSAASLFDFTSAADGSQLKGFRIYGGNSSTMIAVAADDMVIEQNHITTTSRQSWVITFSSATGDTLRNNYIGTTNTSTYRYGISIGSCTDFVASNNLIFGFGSYIYSVMCTGGTNVLISNNIFLNNTNALSTNSSAQTISNNIFMNGSSSQLDISDGGSPEISYNCFFNNTSDGSTGDQPILENPDFVDYSTTDVYAYESYDEEQFDFHLSATSPCIDGGNPLIGFNDLDGSTNDLGIYGWNWPLGTNGAPQMPVINQISVTPSSIAPGETISIEVIGRFGE